MIYIRKQEDLYQNKFNSGLISTCMLTDVRRFPFKVNPYLFTPNENQ